MLWLIISCRHAMYAFFLFSTNSEGEFNRSDYWGNRTHIPFFTKVGSISTDGPHGGTSHRFPQVSPLNRNRARDINPSILQNTLYMHLARQVLSLAPARPARRLISYGEHAPWQFESPEHTPTWSTIIVPTYHFARTLSCQDADVPQARRVWLKGACGPSI